MHAIHTMERPVAPHSEVQVAYFDGQKRTIYTTDEETHFPDGCLITSRTDLDGIITHANNAFVILSGWEREELLGQPHSICATPIFQPLPLPICGKQLNVAKNGAAMLKICAKTADFIGFMPLLSPIFARAKLLATHRYVANPVAKRLKKPKNYMPPYAQPNWQTLNKKDNA